ncbi:DUF6493 family protein [Aeoliella sp.]|uniref:DUF6493 family protein n=1 Tax=Aeoliella sp. TaxID=2795800 RepID=UPI003CCB93C9
MTKEELEKSINLGARHAIADGFANVSEGERKKSSTYVGKILAELERLNRTQNSLTDAALKKASNELKSLVNSCEGGRGLPKKLSAAHVAALAVCPISVTKKISVGGTDIRGKIAPSLQVLMDRRPSWIDEWLQERLPDGWQQISWKEYRILYESGACPKPDSDDYYRLFADALAGYSARYNLDGTKLHEVLSKDDELRNDVWKLFEVETEAFITESYAWEGKEFESWPEAICKLADNSLLDRDRLLDSSLNSLTMDFKQNMISGVAKFHDQLLENDEQRSARQAKYLELLNAKVSLVVTFALKQLKAVDKAKKLDDRAFVAGAGSAFSAPTKSPAKSTLTLLKKIGKRSPELQPRIAEMLIESALRHPADDIVTGAIDLMVQWPEAMSNAAAESLAGTLPDLPAAVQAKARELLSSADVEVDIEETVDTQEVAEQLQQLKSDANELGEPWRSLAGVGDALAAIDLEAWPGPLEFSPLEVPVLTGVEPIMPIETQDELFDVVAHAVEEVTNPADFDRIIDAICRLGREETPEFERLAAPVLKRICDRPYDEAGRCLFIGGRTPVGMVKLLEWWLTGKTNVLFENKQTQSSNWWVASETLTNMHSWINLHFKATLDRLASGHTGPLLSAQTHTGGWIDPLVLVERWKELQEAGAPLLETDLSLALLRLAPDNRPPALEQAAAFNHSWADALRWALGDGDALKGYQSDCDMVWVSAANARGDEASFEALAAAGMKTVGPAVSERPKHSWEARIHTWESRYHPGEVLKSNKLDLSLQPQLPGERYPSVLLHDNKTKRYGCEARWMIAVLASMHPSDASGQIAAGCHKLMERFDDDGSTYEPNYPYIDLLFAEDRPMDELACLMLTIGLAGRDQDVRGLAIDAAIESIADGRLHPAVWGPVLSRLNEPGWLKLNRFGPNLAEVARVGPLHTWVVRQSVDALVAAYEKMPRDATHLLELFNELIVQMGGAASPEAAAVLAKVKGSSKTAKLAKAILACDALESPAAQQGRLELLDRRIARGQRWEGGDI